jgi:succinate dehydrogenase / fumarate reductase flavoprotein subunit
MGGIPTNVDAEVITKDFEGNIEVVTGLMAVGESASVSVHGANRLGSNSLPGGSPAENHKIKQ